MKTFFWTTIFWLIVFCGFSGYIKWFNQDLGNRLVSYIVKQDICEGKQCPICSEVTETGALSSQENLSGIVSSINNTANIDIKLDEIKQQIKEINEKLDIQNSNSPDAISVSLRTTKKTNIWIFPLDGTEHKQYTMSASDDILRDTLNLLLDKSPFTLKSTKLDNDGNLTVILERVLGSSFGGSAMVEQVKSAFDKTATQFPQIKKVIIMPEEVLQP